GGVELDRHMLGQAVDALVDLRRRERAAKHATGAHAEVMPGEALAESRGQNVSGDPGEKRDREQRDHKPASATTTIGLPGIWRWGIVLVNHAGSPFVLAGETSRLGTGVCSSVSCR